MSSKKESDSRTPPARCPNCGAAEVVPVLYGYPGGAAMDAAQRGELELGGCVIADDVPTHACRRCRHRWRYPTAVS